MIIRPFLPDDVLGVKSFTDREVGDGYYSLDELFDLQSRSMVNSDESTSFLLVAEDFTIKGVRLSFAPGRWSQGKGLALRPDLWPATLESTGYFQSLFLSREIQGQGWGPRLSEHSLGNLKKYGARGVATHSWKESPNNSSMRYLERIGFSKIIEHPLYWSMVDYVCTRDGSPCRCTAIEMYKLF